MPPMPNPSRTHLFVPTKERPLSCRVCGQGELNAIHQDGPRQDPQPAKQALWPETSSRPYDPDARPNRPPSGGPPIHR